MKTAAKVGLLTSLYFAQGLPFGFFTQALPAMMRQRGVSLPEIGLSYLLALPWALKFVWAPLVDRHGSARLGRRRSWILPLQVAAAAAMAALAWLGAGPGGSLRPLLCGVFVANLLAATQDIATDALAVDILDERERGLGNGVQVAGYRVGMIVGGGVLLILFDRLGFTNTFLMISVLLLGSTLPIVLYREPPPAVAPPGPEANAEAGAGPGDLYLALLLDFFRRPGGPSWLLVLFIYKSGEALANGMLRTFLVDRGLGLADIGWLLGTVGFAMGLCGALLGGLLVNRLGRRPALVAFGLLQALAVFSYAWAASRHPAPSLAALYGVCAYEHLASGMATAALFTAMMDVSRKETGATDYTIQACVVVLATGAAAAVSGYSAQALGYAGHFGLSTGLCLVAVAAVMRLGGRWESLRRA